MTFNRTTWALPRASLLAAPFLALLLIATPAQAQEQDQLQTTPIVMQADTADHKDAAIPATDDAIPADTAADDSTPATGLPTDPDGDKSIAPGTDVANPDASGSASDATDATTDGATTDDTTAADDQTPAKVGTTDGTASESGDVTDTDKVADATKADDAAADTDKADDAAKTPAAAPATAPTTTPATTNATTQTQAKQTEATKASETKSLSTAGAAEQAGINMYRMYNPNSGEHFYTSSGFERDSLVGAGWSYEGIGWIAPIDGVPVWRLYNPNAGDHHYTTSTVERDSLVGAGWTSEGIGWYSGGAYAVLRQYNPNAEAGAHNFTLNAEEDSWLASLGWSREGTGWHAIAVNTIPYGGFWTLNKAINDNALVWIASNGKMAKGRFVTPEEGAGYLAYATPTGEVVRGTYAASPNVVYIGNTSTGKLYDAGWVTGNFGHGTRRYLIKSNHTCTIGPVTQGDDRYIFLPSLGCAGVGEFTYGGVKYHASGDGVLLREVKATVTIDGSRTTLSSVGAGGSSYIFMPSGTNIGNLSTTDLWAINNNSAAVDIYVAGYGAKSGFTRIARGSSTNIGSIATNRSGVYYLSYRVSPTSSIQTLAFMFSAKVSTMLVVSVDPSHDRAWVEGDFNHERSASVTVLMVNPSGRVIYTSAKDGDASIKGRGNSTWTAEPGGKKPYQVKLAKKADLLGTGDKNNAAKKWLLLANANDVTLLHNTLAYNLGLELGMVGTECAPIDLFYDGEYRGNYLLCEKVEIGDGRVDITDLGKAIEKALEKGGYDIDTLTRTARATNYYGMEYQYISGLDNILANLGVTLDITGGYLLEIDTAYYRSEACWFQTSWGYVVVKEPEYASKSMMKYISEYFELAIRNLNDGNSSANRSGNVFDLNSLAKTVLVSEFTKNIDAFYSSTYFYKDIDSVSKLLYAMPLWDFDGSMGARIDRGDHFGNNYSGFICSGTVIKGPSSGVVLARARSLWTTRMSALIHNVVLGGKSAVGSAGKLRSLAYYRDQISVSQRLNQMIFGLTAFVNEMKPYDTYDANYNFLVNWIRNRAGFFDDEVWKWTASTAGEYVGIYNGQDYGLVFDAAYYLRCNPDVAAVYGYNNYWGALEHFVYYGVYEFNRAGTTCRNFNVRTYMNAASNWDLRAAFGGNIFLYYLHYIQYGFWEGRVAV